MASGWPRWTSGIGTGPHPGKGLPKRSFANSEIVTEDVTADLMLAVRIDLQVFWIRVEILAERNLVELLRRIPLIVPT
jgi:hypothetical protein